MYRLKNDSIKNYIILAPNATICLKQINSIFITEISVYVQKHLFKSGFG